MRHLSIRELHPLPVLDTRWDTLSMDFIMELPESSRCNTIMAVVNSISKRAHFILMHTTVTAEGAARLFLYNIWKLHGLPKCVISDH